MALVYHRVASPSSYPFLARGGTPVISPRQLAKEIGFLQALGAKFFTFGDLRAGNFPRSDEFGVVLTFDDGFRDNYFDGLQVLDKSGVKAVIFQSSAMVDAPFLVPEHALYWYASEPSFSNKLSQLVREAGWPGSRRAEAQEMIVSIGRWIREVQEDSLNQVITRMRETFGEEEQTFAMALYPTRSDLQRAVKAGHEIGSHGDKHLPRSVLNEESFERELRLSSVRLAQITGIAPAAFSYPFNSYFPGDREICSRYFQQVATVDANVIERDTDPLSLPRFSWPGTAQSGLRFRRWMLTGRI